MATPVLYTTVEAIRACLGLDVSDLPNAVIQDRDMAIAFSLDLDSWYPSDYVADWAAGGYDPVGPTSNAVSNITESKKKAYLLSLYSMWFGAEQALIAQMSIPQSVSDGEKTIARFKSTNLDKVMGRVVAEMMQAKEAIKNLYSTVEVTRLSTAKSTNGLVNPVTGL